jgi:hypothetical protein
MSDFSPVTCLRFNRPRRNRRGPERSLPEERQFVSRTNAHWDDDLYSAGRDDLSITWFRAINPKSNPVIRVAVCGTLVVTIIDTIIHK